MTVLNRQPGSKTQDPEHIHPFEILYEQYYQRVYRYFRAHLEHEEDAADLTQQVFFQVWMHLSTYQPGKGSFATWLFSIARHRLVDFFRAVRFSESWESLYEIAITDLNPEEIVISAETIARVKALIDALPRSERELLALRFAARLSFAEIALIIGKSEEATKKRLARLIRRLQEQYRRQEAEKRHPDLWEPAIPTFLSALYQVYAVAPPTVRLTFLHRKTPIILSHIVSL
jgi:RNA polymerase sigma-70 factor (ECF subfamily)